ncbi:MAG: thioesterase II family protein [Flammeovirgaceae bacterium]
MKLKLIIIPFGGGNKYSYESIKKSMPPEIELCCVELPGRGFRMDEELLTSVTALTDDIVKTIGNPKNFEYALFGHCLGALLSFTVAQKLVKVKPPLRLFVSGCGGPASFNEPKNLALTRDDIKRFLILFDVPLELANDESFIEMMEPIITADLTAHHSYQYVPSLPLPSPITVIQRDDYPIKEELLALWQQETTIPIDYCQIHRSSYDADLSTILIKGLSDQIHIESKYGPIVKDH